MDLPSGTHKTCEFSVLVRYGYLTCYAGVKRTPFLLEGAAWSIVCALSCVVSDSVGRADFGSHLLVQTEALHVT